MPRTNSELLQIDSMNKENVNKYSAAIMGILKEFWDEVDRREHETIKQQVNKLMNVTASNYSATPPQASTSYTSTSSHGGNSYETSEATSSKKFGGYKTAGRKGNYYKIDDYNILIFLGNYPKKRAGNFKGGKRSAKTKAADKAFMFPDL